MPPGQEQVAIIVDVSCPTLCGSADGQYKSATSQSNPSISTARKVLNILQNHYVERERSEGVMTAPAHEQDSDEVSS